MQLEKSPQAQTEEQILAFWEKNEIFKKSLEKPGGLSSPKGEFVFYDGPPFATGEPHYGHVVPGTIKDIIPRYKTMKGYRVRRRWGWDCHGLPVENIIEKELNFQSKKEIIDYGIGKFNQKASESVMRYADDWRNIIPRLGRWVDMDDDYRTMDASYTESVWWAFSELHKKGLIYEGFKSMHLCPRCETTLSNFEVSQGYKDITDISVYVKFELADSPGTFLLAWTTTPWTLPGNAALAINPSFKYVKIEVENSKYILAESRLGAIKSEYQNLGEVKVGELLGKKYKPLFNYYSSEWKVYAGDFVTAESGTGIVHIAPAFGADDYELSLKENIPFIQHVGTNGKFKSEVTDFAGQDVKPKNDHQRADIEIIKYLAGKNLLFAKEKVIHSYPHCWRCDTPLLNYSSSSWFVKVTEIKDKLVKQNKKVKWIPPEVGEGRFGNWLEGARDWAISRSRFWGAPLPVWKNVKTGEATVLGSIEELKKHSKARNIYYVMRHGEAENNSNSVVSSLPENPHHLTAKGKKQVDEAVSWLKDKKIDLIFSSPFVRTMETAEIVAKGIGCPSDKINIEDDIRELNAGIWNGKPFPDFVKFFDHANRFNITPEGGENYADIKKRMGDFLYGLEKKFEGKNILIITHDSPSFLLMSVTEGLTRKRTIELRGRRDHYIENGKPFALNFSPLPHNEEYELDFHRPSIDDIELTSAEGDKLIRIPEVFDCWFESGSMPFAEVHYPFEKEEFNPKRGPFSKILGKAKGYPADFIAEGLDQTRG
ncbi:MAG: class I tRNA ligase family protein, partial [bacterium]|nr:class I tRNA ligase family protein [bacterium]